MINFKRLLNTPLGKILISIILGIGLATLFRKVCTDKNCIVFHGPVINNIEDKIYGHGDKCYKYKVIPDTCNPMKRIIDISEDIDNEKSGS
jgi:hypothetical protein